jgi:hypothetical protein
MRIKSILFTDQNRKTIKFFLDKEEAKVWYLQQNEEERKSFLLWVDFKKKRKNYVVEPMTIEWLLKIERSEAP